MEEEDVDRGRVGQIIILINLFVSKNNQKL